MTPLRTREPHSTRGTERFRKAVRHHDLAKAPTTSDHPRNRRLDAAAYNQPGTPVLITIRANTGQPFVTNPELSTMIVSLLREMAPQYGCILGAYCLLPDHLHFTATPAQERSSVLTFVERFKGKTTNRSWTLGHSGKLWQNRFHDHVLRTTESLDEVHRYILENPVRVGLVQDVVEWPWSGISDT